MVLSASSSGGWYSDSALFIYSTYDFSWFNRGGAYDNATYAGIFRFNGSLGGSSGTDSTRAILVSLK